MIAALLIAATLQSAQIGEFFTLPAWLPRTVGSHDTPGSDPLYNPTNGWYVAEYTNALSRSSWTCSCFGITSVRDLDFLEGNSEWRIYYAVDEMLRMAYPEGEFGITDVTPAYVGGPYEREIIDIGNVVVSNWYGTALIEVARSPFYATRNTTPVPTGRRVPRAARLTPEVQASVNSTFEGWCERLYYASQGQSNVWDTAVYGGTSPSTFRFPSYYVDEVPRYSIASNRTVTTRRLIEHTNICEYATIFLDYHKQRWEFETSKPGWVPYSGNAFIYWSSTAPALREHGDSRAFIPTFSDVADPTAGSTADEWKISCPTFCRLKGDDVWERDAWEWSNPEPHPCIDLMSNVSFNQPFYHPERCAWANTNNLTMAYLITNAYPFVRSGGITNETRRLISDRLCEMNQYLGLMNSTYVVNTLTYPTEGTNTHYETEVTCEGIPSVSWTWNPYQHEFEGTFGGIEWLSPQETNRITKSSRQQSGCIHHRIEGTTTSYELDTYGREYSIPIPGPTSDDVESIASSFLYDLGRDHVYFEMEIVPEYWNGTPRITYTVTEWILPTEESGTVASEVTNVYHFTVVPDSNSIGRVNSVYTRSYSYAHTFGDMVIGATQPGRDAGDRAITNMLGIVTGIHYREDSIPDSLSNMYWYDVWSHSIYGSRQLAYSTRADIIRELQTSADGLLFAKVISMYGWNPTDWRNIIQITDEARVRQSTQLTNIRLNVQQNTREPFGAPAKTRVLGWCFSEPYRCEVYSVETEYSEGRTEIGYCDFWAGCPTFEYENETPNEYEHDGLAVDAKLGVITRTDWNWKSLRRTDDNQ